MPHAQHTIASTIQIRLRALGKAAVIQVVQRGFDDSQRRVEFVRQLGGQRAQVVGVAADHVEQARETARQIAQLILCLHLRERPVEAAIVCLCRFSRITQTPQAQAQSRSEK